MALVLRTALVLFITSTTISICSSYKALTAPSIVQSPKAEVAYKPGEDVTLTCVADTESSAFYEWRKDGRVLNVTGKGIMMLSGAGNIVLKAPTDEMDGVYQCYARNQFGSAVSSKASVRKAVLDPFPTVYEPVPSEPVVGEPLSLPCSTPKSYPKGNSYWGKNRPHSNNLEGIENSDRVMLDYEGNLHFANVVPADSLGGTTYVCIVNNALLGAYVQGNDQTVSPVVRQDSPVYHAPRLLWSSPSMDVAVKGQSKQIKCIFSGLPTPKVTWRRLDRNGVMSSRVSVTPAGFGMELEITNMELEDAGQYECSASNSETGTRASRTITIIVQSAPFWSPGRSPPNVQVEEESIIEIDCQAHGTPKPDISFMINGIPLSEFPPNPRRVVDGYKMSYRNATTTDSQVIQCIASNEHGSILANIIVTVLAAPPSFIETPSSAKVVQGRRVLFRCHAYGAPKPKVIWTKGSSREPVSEGTRFILHSSGNLEIQDALVSDSGIYTCHAGNKFGMDEVAVDLIVRLPTIIDQFAKDVVVNASDHVILPCNVETDPAERSDLVIEWRKDNRTIDFSMESHLVMNADDFSLEIKKCNVRDTALYSCHARSSVDSATSLPMMVTVRGRPDSPYDVKVITCTETTSVVSWRVGNDNNSPQVEFIVFYNNSINSSINGSINSSNHFQEGARLTTTNTSRFVTGQEVQAELSVRPWTTYAFFVIARNLLGVSDPSAVSAELCVTPQVAPYRNPSGVCSRLRGPTQLVIVWEEVPRSEWNGEGFHYVVSYRRLDLKEQPKKSEVRNASQTELVIHDLNAFVKYEIFVQSGNNIGVTPIKNDEKRTGYSGEGKPQASPRNFRLTAAINRTYAEFTWEPVDTSPDRIRGFFRGYRIVFWKTAEPHNVRHEDVIIVNDFDLCPPLEEKRGRPVRQSSMVSGSTRKLWPYSRITAGIQVLNRAQSGPLSDTIEFPTPEGVPGVVSSVTVTERGSSHLRLEWTFPAEPNGIVTGYRISYHVAPPAVSKLQTMYITGPLRLSQKLINLEFLTMYEIFVSAMTAAGPGESVLVHGETLPAGAPDRPVISNVELGSDCANVTWVASEISPAINPGSHFHLEYRLKGVYRWNRVEPDPDSNENWANVTGLDPGTYEFQAVARNGNEDSLRQSRSSITAVDIGLVLEVKSVISVPVNIENTNTNETDEGVAAGGVETAPVLFEKASSDWFIILMCLLVLLLVILIIACIVRHNRGEIYPVFEKEKKWGHDPYAQDDVPFGEYNRTPRANSSKSQLSIDSDEKPIDSDSDSLGEYEEQDAAKFNEDGSFIGLYAGKTRSPRTNNKNAVPSALDTFV